jgi:hypothetical protein
MDDQGKSPGRSYEFFTSPPRPDQLWSPPSLLSSGLTGVLSLGVNRAGREADHSPPSSAEAKNAWSYTSTPEYAFMARCLVKAQDNETETEKLCFEAGISLYNCIALL